MLVRLLVTVIHAYRKLCAPFMICTCRFIPTCSRYAEEALIVHGVFRGAGLTFRRLLRCQPLSSAPVVDQVPRHD